LSFSPPLLKQHRRIIILGCGSVMPRWTVVARIVMISNQTAKSPGIPSEKRLCQAAAVVPNAPAENASTHVAECHIPCPARRCSAAACSMQPPMHIVAQYQHQASTRAGCGKGRGRTSFPRRHETAAYTAKQDAQHNNAEAAATQLLQWQNLLPACEFLFLAIGVSSREGGKKRKRRKNRRQDIPYISTGCHTVYAA
jgi:hypothetical protein